MIETLALKIVSWAIVIATSLSIVCLLLLLAGFLVEVRKGEK